MNPLAAGVIGAVIGGVIVLLVDAIDAAPEGWQDAEGWHPGEGADDDDTSEWAERERPEQ